MSGGIAYVYDVNAQFNSLCNKEMVDLDKVAEEDIDELKTMIQKHYAYTASAVAKFVLDDFENQLKNFVKVFPKDYKKSVAAKKEKYRVQSDILLPQKTRRHKEYLRATLSLCGKKQAINNVTHILKKKKSYIARS